MFETQPQPFARLFEPAHKRAARPAELLRRFVSGETVEVAQEQRIAERARQPAHLLVEQAAKFLPCNLGERVVSCGGASVKWRGYPPPRLGLAADAQGCPVQPGR